MRIGVSLSSSHQVDHHADGARWMVERAAASARAGLDVLSIGDHHVGTTPYYQNTPMLGRMLAEWPSDRPAGCLFLVPMWHPVLMAEQIGTLAAIHGGPFVVQTGLGHGRALEVMGSSARRRVGDLVEGMRVVQALLAGETVSSERFGFTDAAVSPLPPGPVEWWIGAAAPAAIERAARWSGTWYAGPNLTPDAGAELIASFRDACTAAGRDVDRLVARQDVVVAETDAEARELAAPVLEAGYRGMPADVLAIGSVDTVATHFDHYRRAGFTDIMVRQMTIPQEAALRSIELVGEVRRELGLEER